MALFGKDPTPPKAGGTRPDQNQRPLSSSIGVNLLFDGVLTGKEDLLIEGTVKGAINLESNLTIGPNARVQASVHAKNVHVEGTMAGDVSADAKVELMASAKVDGNIKAPKIVVAEGAMFKGAVDMGSAEKKTQSADSKENKGNVTSHN